jgi:hypothetical protein
MWLSLEVVALQWKGLTDVLTSIVTAGTEDAKPLWLDGVLVTAGTEDAKPLSLDGVLAGNLTRVKNK